MYLHSRVRHLPPNDVLSAHVLSERTSLHSASRAEGSGCSEKEHSVHTVGQSDGTFWRNDGASVSTCPASGHSGGFNALSDTNGGKSCATNRRSGHPLTRTCPKAGKPSEADAQLYWGVVQTQDAAGHSHCPAGH